jgi:hypothetical protein
MMVDVSQEILDSIFSELAALRSEVAGLKAMGALPTEETITLKEAARKIGRSDEFLRRKLIHGAKFGEKLQGRWVVHATLLREWWPDRKAGAR